MVGCHPKVLAQLSSEEYQEVKDHVNKCLTLVAGDKPRKSSAKRSGVFAGIFTLAAFIC